MSTQHSQDPYSYFPAPQSDVFDDFERSILIDDSFDDRTEILTILRERVAREGAL